MSEKKKTLKLIELWMKETGRVAFLYPQKDFVRFDGHKIVETSEAIEMMMREVPEIELELAGL